MLLVVKNLLIHSRSCKVIRNYTDNLEVTQGHRKWYHDRKLWYGFLFAFYSNYGRNVSRFDAIHERDRHAPTQPPHDTKGRRRACA